MSNVCDIADIEDPRIEAFRNIRERDLARNGECIAEGVVVLAQLLQSRAYRPASILILRNRLTGLSTLLSQVPPDIPIYVADRPLIDHIIGFPMHRGVLAHGIRVAPARTLSNRLQGIAQGGGTTVVAIGIANHDNMGAIFRNAAAFAAGMVLIDETSCDPLYRKAIRVSAGAVFHVPFERRAGTEITAALQATGFAMLALSPNGAPDLALLERPGPTALFLGSEGTGLPRELIAAMPSFRIDMAPGFDSLNVATSAAIVLQRLYSARHVASG